MPEIKKTKTHINLNQNTILFLIFALLLTFLSFHSSLNNKFLNWDDNFHLTENSSLHSLNLWNIKKIFTETVNEIYIPLSTLSYAIEYHFFKYNPFIYHLDNLILHLLIVCLVYFFTINLGFSNATAGLASLLFGIHPIHVESVAWITERKDVLYSFFYMLAVINYCVYLQKDHKHFYFLSLFFGLMSILSKPMALSLPLILILCDWWKNKLFNKKTFINKIPFLLYIVPITWITYRLHARLPGEENLLDSFLLWTWSVTFYLIKFVYPASLIPLYQAPSPISLHNPHYLLSLSILIFGILLLTRYHKNKTFIFAITFYFFSMFFLFRYDIGADLGIVTDRFMYLPSVGFCILFASLFVKFYQKIHKNIILKCITIFLLLSIVSGLCRATYRQCKIWNNELTFWNYVIKKSPDLAIAYNNRGNVYDQLGRYDLAIDDFDTAIRLKADYLLSLCNRGTLTYFHEKSYANAMKYFNRALAINPNFARGYHLLGIINVHEKQYQQAEESFLAAYEKGKDLSALIELSKLQIITGKNNDAIKTIEKLLIHDLPPNKKRNLLSKLAALYYKIEKREECYRIIHKIFQKNNVKNFIILIENFEKMELNGAAIELLEQGLKIYPKNKDLFYLYGNIMLKQKMLKQAIYYWESGLKLDPNDSRFENKINSIKKQIP